MPTGKTLCLIYDTDLLETVEHQNEEAIHFSALRDMSK